MGCDTLTLKLAYISPGWNYETNSTDLCLCRETNSCLVAQEIPGFFTEPESSFPCSQESAGGFYPQTGTSSPRPSILILSVSIVFFHLCLGLPSCPFRSGFPVRTFSMLPSLQCVHIPCITHVLSFAHSNNVWEII